MSFHAQMDIPLSLLAGKAIHRWDLPRPAFWRWFSALFWSLYILLAFDQGQSHLARQHLHTIPWHDTTFPQSHTLQQVAIRRDIARLRFWLHLILGARACYAESLALAAGLRTLGWSATVVIGYEAVDLGVNTPMHAWIEYLNEPVSDPIDTPAGFVIVEKIGVHDALS